MNPLLKTMMARLMAPAGEDGADTGGTDTAVADRGDIVDPALTPENLEAVAGADGGDGGDDPPSGEPAAAAPGEPEEHKSASGGIPKPRFDQVNQKRKDALAQLAAAQEEIARLKGEKPAAAPQPVQRTEAQAPAPVRNPPADSGIFDVEAQEEAYIAALMEGDSKGAVAIRKEINAHLQEEASARATQELTTRQAAQLLKSTADSVAAAYPWLNKPEASETLELILAARDRKISAGMPPHLALAEAANTIAPKFAPADDGGTPSSVSGTGASAKDLRPAAAIARGAADSTAQPPALQVGIGERATATRVNVAQLTEEQFEALTPAEKKRLRGD